MKKCVLPAVVQLAVVLLGTSVAAACAARGESLEEQVTEPSLRQALLLSSAPGPPDRTCHVVREDLPPADQLIDSVAVTNSIQRLDPSSVLLSIKFDTLGVTDFVRIIESEGAAADRLVDVVEQSLRRQPESDAWRLKVVSGPDPVIRVGHSEFCRPVLLTAEVVDRVLSDAGVREPGPTGVMFRVGPEGRALETRVSYHTGPPGMERAFLSLGPYMLFEPALIDGFPTPVWVSITIQHNHAQRPRVVAWQPVGIGAQDIQEDRMVRTPGLTVGAIVLLCSACAHAPDRTPPEQGMCYTAHIGEWTPATQPSPRQQPPEVFELLDEIGTAMFEEGRTVVRPVIGAAAPYSGHPSASWSMPSPDSLVVTWTNGYEGVRLRVRAGEADGWTGQASTFTDVIIAGRPTPTAPVDLERVACP